jgi:hypothetical protein
MLPSHRRLVATDAPEEVSRSPIDLYTRALIPGLAPLHGGEEAVAVGICETKAGSVKAFCTK